MDRHSNVVNLGYVSDINQPTAFHILSKKFCVLAQRKIYGFVLLFYIFRFSFKKEIKLKFMNYIT